MLDLEAVIAHCKRLEPLAKQEWERLAKYQRYMRGDQEKPYTPRNATGEYKALQARSMTNLIPLVVRGVTQRLYVDGHKASPTDSDNSTAWKRWQANQMDMRQKALFEAAGIFGYAYCSAMPAADDPSFPIIRPRSPLSWFGEFEDETEDVWPLRVIRITGERYTLVDAEATYRLRLRKTTTGQTLDVDLADPDDPDSWFTEHRVLADGVPVCPWRLVPVDVALTGKPQGDVEPQIPVQDRLNQTVFDLLLAQTYSSTKVRVITGMVPPSDGDGAGPDEYEEDEPRTPEQEAARAERRAMANRRSPLELYADKLLIAESPDAKVSTLDESNLEQLVGAISNCLRIFGLASQTPPHDLLGEMVNVSAEGLIAAEASRGFKVADRKTILGEALEDVLRVAAGIAGDDLGADDQAAQIIWRDTDPRSFAATVDALGKLALMLDVPVRYLWSKIPGVTQTDLVALEAAAEAEGPVERARRQAERELTPTADEPIGAAA